MQLRALVAVSLAACAAAVPLACVDTKGAFDDYNGRSQSLRDLYNLPQSDAQANDNASSFKGKYFLLCLSPLVSGDTSRTLRFRVNADFQATAPGTGSLTFSLQALKVGATSVGAVTGPEFGAPASPVAGGTFDMNVGDTPGLPADANPLTGVDWGINKLVFSGAFTDPPKAFCAKLTGATRPSGLDASGTVCLFKRVETDDEQVTIPEASAFTCPR